MGYHHKSICVKTEVAQPANTGSRVRSMPISWYVRYDGIEVDGPFRKKDEAQFYLDYYMRVMWRTYPKRELFELHPEAR